MMMMQPPYSSLMMTRGDARERGVTAVDDAEAKEDDLDTDTDNIRHRAHRRSGDGG
jgi:hypothetical protein